MTRVTLGLAYLVVVIPLAGGWAAGGLTSRIPKFEDWSNAWVHTVAVGTFAIILTLSALVNAVIISTRIRTPPASYTHFERLPLVLVVENAAGVVWVATIATATSDWSDLEPLCAIVIACTSIATFILAMRPDRLAMEERERHDLEIIEASLRVPLRTNSTNQGST